MTGLPSPPRDRVVSALAEFVIHDELRSSFYLRIGACVPVLVIFVASNMRVV